MKILFTGGGTGGHVFPLVAIIRELRRIYPKNNLELFYAGAKDEFGTILLSQENVNIKNIISGKIRRYFSLQNIVDICFKIPAGTVQSFFWLLKNRPAIIFSKGGSGSVAVVFAAKLLKIPIFIHESDFSPGLSNKTASKWAEKIFISFAKTEFLDLSKTILVGNPIRKELLEGDTQTAKKLFNLTFEKPIILFIGGSQGAEFINNFVLANLDDLLREYEIIHTTGRENFKQTQAESAVVINQELERYYHPIGFLEEENLKHAYSASDFIVSRSGSGSIFEIAALGKPSILVPLPGSASEHQSKNAYVYSQTGACIVMEQENLTKNFFLEKLHYLFSHQEKLDEMKKSALEFAKPMAAKTIAREILEYLMIE